MYQSFRSVSYVTLQVSKEKFHVLPETLGTLFHPRFNLSHRSMVDTSVWNPKVKFTNLPANFILLQDTGSLLHETENSFCCFSFCSVYITEKKTKQNTPFPPPPPKKNSLSLIMQAGLGSTVL